MRPAGVPHPEVPVSPLLVLLVLIVMGVGLVGTVLPVLPGLPLIWLAGLASFLTTGFERVAWLTMLMMTLLMVGGVVAKYVLPSRQGGQTASRRSMLWAAVGAGVGFFVVPVVGFVIGGVAGLYLAEVQRTGDGDIARRTTLVAIRRFGLGVLVEIAAGISMILVWLMAAILA